MIVTENNEYALRVANARVADRQAGGWPPKGHSVMTPWRPLYPCSVCLVMASTFHSRRESDAKFEYRRIKIGFCLIRGLYGVRLLRSQSCRPHLETKLQSKKRLM
jgi:hypothetical protein